MDLINKFVNRSKDILKENLVGIYLHGSSVMGCFNPPTIGAHIINPAVYGEKIVPMCDACNKKTGMFDLDFGVTLVSANKSETCEKY